MSRVTRAIEPPREVVEIAEKLEKAGYETWCVGGGVRDALLGQRSLDWDLATAATPDIVRKLFRRTIPVGEKFGTIAVLDRHNVKHEVTTFRKDVATDGRHADVAFGVSLDDDLARRDFTINAIAYSPRERRLHDPFSGIADLERGALRAVGEPHERMREDRLRALRAIRFAARFEFVIDPATWDALVASAPYLRRLSAERVKQEIEKTMEQVRCPGAAFGMWREAGALRELVPPLAQIDSVQLAALDELPSPHQAGQSRRRMLRLMALFAAAEPDAIAGMLRDLRFSNADVRWICDTVGRWHRLDGAMSAALQHVGGATDRELREWAATAGRTRLSYVLRLAAAYWGARRAAGRPAPTREAIGSAYRRALLIAYRDPIEVSDLAVDGSDLERLGLSGPAVGRALQELLAAVVENPADNTPDKLRDLAVSMIAADTSARPTPRKPGRS
jgi:tRNA nucleotidyltransferase (CCA-adding enzyme)